MSNVWVTLLREGQKLKDIEIRGEVWVGRSETCGIRLDDRAISREHALFRATDSGLEITKKSQFGVLKVNGRTVSQALLKTGDELEFGPFVIEVREAPVSQNASIEGASAQPSVAPDSQSPPPTDVEPDLGTQAPLELPVDLGEVSSESSALMSQQTGSLSSPLSASGSNSDVFGSSVASESSGGWGESESADGATRILGESSVQARLEFPVGSANVTEWIVGSDPVVLGRGQDCQVILNDKKASRRHTLIERVGQKFLVRDLSSVNGTFVNEVKIEERELGGDDVLRIGDTEFRFQVLNLDFNKNQNDFLKVPEDISDESPAAPPAIAFGGSLGATAGQPLGMWNPGGGGVSGLGGAAPNSSPPNSIVERLKSVGPRKLVIRAAIVLGALYFLWDEAPEPARQREKASVSRRDVANKAPGASTKLTFEKLTPEQKKFVIAQHDIAFEFLRNQEFQNAIVEVRKIFELVDDYKQAREIERYAIEGKRKLEVFEQNQRKEREQAELKAKIESLKTQIETLMTQKDYAAARDLFPQLQQLDPENPLIGKWQAEIKSYFDDLELAEKRKEAQVAINAAGWELYQNGMVLRKRGRCRAAQSDFRKIVESDASDAKLMKSARAGISACEAEIAARVGPLLEAGKLAEDSKEYLRAFQHYERIDLMDPGHRAAREGRERIRGILHERAKFLYTEAVVAESYSDFENAKRKFEECLATAPKDDIYYERARRKLNKFLRLEGSWEGSDGSGAERGAASL